LRKGEARGILHARRNDLRALLEKRFGTLPEAVLLLVQRIEDPERLKSLILEALYAPALEALDL
jgi:hypothetical protein